MNVLLWSPGGAGSHYHGPATQSYRMYRHHDPARLHLTLVHGSDRQEEHPDIFKRQIFLSRLAPAAWLSPSPSLSLFDQYRRRLLFIRQGKKWLDENFAEFDVFHGMSSYSFTLLPALHATKLGLPVCTMVANLRGELEDQSAWRRLLKVSERRLALISQLDSVVAISRDIERTLLEKGVPEEKVVYIPNSVDPSRFRPEESLNARRSLRRKLGLRDDPVIVLVGELTERKGAHLLLQALSELEAFRLGWQLVFAGPPNDRIYAGQLVAYVEDQGWHERVHFLGHINNIEDVYKAADIFCLPSKDEGMPGALLEAMISGLACIVTPFSSARELIDDGARGRIVSRSRSDIASALKDYLSDERLRTAHGSAARQTVLTGYTTEIVLSNYIALFGRLIAGVTPRA